jgi:cytosine/adenosine deaminase-related metal-dependent hydrolase
MSTVAEIRAATRKLPVADRVDLFVDLAMDDAVQKAQLARLRAAIAAGVADHAAGRYTELVTDDDFKAFAAEIKREGRARLKAAK